jgi:hypothetical protein
MVARARKLPGELLPHGWMDAARQLSLFVFAYAGYTLARGLAEGNANAAFAHARDLIALERALHFFVEPSVQAWASSSHVVIALASWLYINAQGPISIAALTWLYLRRNSSFYFVRNMFVIAMFVAIVGYLIFPTAPPRFLPEWGFTDPVQRYTGINLSEHSSVAEGLFNPYAAVPSMHVAFALMIGWPLSRLVRSRAAAIAWIVYPFVMTFVIVVTANHFIVDALFGAMTAGMSAYAAKWLGRARPAAWQFARVRAPAPVRLTASG